MRPKLLDPNRRTSTNQVRSRRQESAVAEDLGGRRTPASGSQWHSKGDVKAAKILVECKTTEKRTYTLHVEDLKKIAAHGILERRLGVMQVEFGDGSSWAILSWRAFKELIDDGVQSEG